jgi:hypothetical protein
MDTVNHPFFGTALITLAVLCLVAFRVLRQRVVRVDRLWILPALVLLLVFTNHGRIAYTPSGFAVIALGLVIGGAIGWLRARFSIKSIDVANRQIITQGGAWMLLLVLAIAAIKIALRSGLAGAWHEWLNVGLFLAVGSVLAQRAFLYRAYLVARRQAVGAPDRTMTAT